MPSRKEVRELAEKIHGWNEADVDAVVIAMRLATVDQRTYRQAMKIVREELIPAASARQVDEEAAVRGRYPSEKELAEQRAALEALPPPALTEADLARLQGVSAEVLKSVLADHPNATGEEAEREFRKRLAARAVQ